MEDLDYVQQAIEQAKKSYKQGVFPAGALIVEKDFVVARDTATAFPKIHLHPESKVIDKAMSKLNQQLKDCTLYSSMEPCLMCLSRAYWAGIRKIVFAIKKESVPYKLCYESNRNHFNLVENFNDKVEMIHMKNLEGKVLPLVMKWIKQNT